MELSKKVPSFFPLSQNIDGDHFLFFNGSLLLLGCCLCLFSRCLVLVFVDTALLGFHPDEEWYPEAPRGGAGWDFCLREGW
jgi:hypothetical protein